MNNTQFPSSERIGSETMKRRLLLGLILLSSGFLFGCSANRLGDSLTQSEIKRLPMKYYTQNFAKSKSTGILYVISQPASTQMVIQNYYYSINGNRFFAFKNSVTKVFLDEGSYVISGGDNFFGFSAATKVGIISDFPTCLVFQGPLDILAKGKFWKVSCPVDILN
jgi:hypothetical protein